MSDFIGTMISAVVWTSMLFTIAFCGGEPFFFDTYLDKSNKTVIDGSNWECVKSIESECVRYNKIEYVKKVVE